MTPKNDLDLQGYFRIHPLAELIAEIDQARLDGSLRMASDGQKMVFYFTQGRLVFAVSNKRRHRLFHLLLEQKRIDQKFLAGHPSFANDLEFAAGLREKGAFTHVEIRSFIASQIETVLIDAVSWPDGDFLFSPLARPRADLIFENPVFERLIDYARCVPAQTIANRFRGLDEEFVVNPDRPDSPYLQAHEKYVLSQFGELPLTIPQLRDSCSLPESGLLQSLYVLWLGGILRRHKWNAAFSDTRIESMRSAKVSLVSPAHKLVSEQNHAENSREEQPVNQPAAVEPEIKIPQIDLSLEEYLKQVSAAETHYDILGVPFDASLAQIKNSYFGMAKLFHPDHYHREDVAVLRQVQIAFTELANAYETLKTAESRESYDYKMRKEIEARNKRVAAGISAEPDRNDVQVERGLESFETGVNLLLEEEYEDAAVYFARAVHYNPQNALYHAYFGKALSADEKYRHKAESEMQAAAKLDPTNPKIRIMLAEFFIEMNMLKRAEGELKRFLEVAPQNQEARSLLDSLQPR